MEREIDPKKFVEEVREFQKHLDEATKHTQDVKEGRCTPEDEKEEPAFKLYNSIVESTVKILQNDVVQDALMVIGKQLGPAVMSAFVQILTVSMTYSAHEAVVFYDELLKKDLTRQFDNLGEAVNTAGSLVNAHAGVLKVMSQRLQTLENESRLKQET